jgi:hypothetical protein
MKMLRVLLACAVLTTVAHIAFALDASFPNQGSISKTRHNLSLTPGIGDIYLVMDNWRNNYGEVCVYCHTPHGANSNVSAPLWNRNIPNTTYTTYNQLNTSSLTQTVSQPGAASLTCLSCHDGQQAIDAIINMPGSGRYKAEPNMAFLDAWQNASGYGGPGGHSSLNANITWVPSGWGFDWATTASCLVCHSPAVPGHSLTGTATDFTVAALGTDLRDDHPVGVTFPATTGAGTDWKTPASGVFNGQTVKFFDDTANGRMDKNEIRLYDSGNGPSVECASCHDPHGVPSAGPGSKFFPTFMRKSNSGSALCMTCHAK